MSAKDVYFVFVIFDLLLGLALLFAQLYFSHFKLDMLVGLLSNSYGVKIRHPFMTMGFGGKMFLTMNLSWMLFRHKVSIRNGELDPQDYENIPSALRVYSQGMHLFGFVMGVLMIILFIVGKFSGWLK